LSCICINPAMPDIYAAGSYTKSLGKWFGYQIDGEAWEGACGCSRGFRYLTVHNGAGLCDLSSYSAHSFHSFLCDNRCDHIRNWYQLTLHALREDTHRHVFLTYSDSLPKMNTKWRGFVCLHTLS
jgi:hypothetical protein